MQTFLFDEGLVSSTEKFFPELPSAALPVFRQRPSKNELSLKLTFVQLTQRGPGPIHSLRLALQDETGSLRRLRVLHPPQSRKP